MYTYYKNYSKKKEYEKDEYADNFFSYIDFSSINKKEVEKFLKEWYKNENNKYRRKKVIEIICTLYFSGEIDINKHYILLILLEIEENEDTYIIQTALKYLFYFYESDPEEIEKKIKAFIDHRSADVSSEAYFRLGLIQFTEIYIEDRKKDFIKALNKARDYFRKSKILMENSTKAEFYYLITEYLYYYISENKVEIEDKYDKLISKLWQRQIYSLNYDYIDLDFQFFKVINNLQSIYYKLSEVNGWIDSFFNYVKQLSKYHCDLINIEITSSNMYNSYLNNFKKNIQENILNPFYRVNLTSQQIKIDNLLSEVENNNYPVDTSIKDMLYELKSVIKNKNNQKKNEDLKLILKLASIFPKENIDQLAEDLKSMDPNDSYELLDKVENYIKISNQNNGFIAGTPQGEEIFLRLKTELQSKLFPKYKAEHFGVFLSILELVIQYTINTIKERYDFLFSEDASERDLQDSLYEFLKNSRLQYGFDYEKTKFADGGRVDIVFSNNGIKFPIELKKTKVEISSKRIEQEYLGQVQTYIYPYNQLGIFVLLDLNYKKAAPLPDVRQLFTIHHLEPIYMKKKENWPDYIVSVIVPGNKILPSKRSKYN